MPTTPSARHAPPDPAAQRSPSQTAGRRCGRQAGSVSVELVIATPLLLLLLLGIVQFALWAHATHIAQAAAAQGLAAGRVQGGGPAAGEQTARGVLAQIGTGVLQAPTVTAQESGARMQVAVSGYAEPVIPFLHLRVHATTLGPVEAVYPDTPTP